MQAIDLYLYNVRSLVCINKNSALWILTLLIKIKLRTLGRWHFVYLHKIFGLAEMNKTYWGQNNVYLSKSRQLGVSVKRTLIFFSSIFSALRRSAGNSRLRSSLTFWSVVLIKFRRWQVSTLYFSVSYICNKLLIIVIHIGRRMLSAYFRFIMKKMLMQILLQNLRIVLSSLKIIGTHYHEATV